MIAKIDQLCVENLKTLFRDLIRRYVVDRDLKIIETCFIELLYLFDLEIITVRDQPGDHSVMPDAGNDVVYLRMHHRLAAGDGNYRRSKLRKLVYTLEHCTDRHRIARLVVFVAVSAGQITSSHRHDVHQHGMLCRSERPNRVSDAAREPAETACLWHYLELVPPIKFVIIEAGFQLFKPMK